MSDAERKRRNVGSEERLTWLGKNNVPLHLGAMNGHTDVVVLLLEAGARPNEINENGRTPLHAAAAFGHMDTVLALLKGGADTSVRDKDDKTPLDMATEGGHVAVADLLKGCTGTIRTQ